LRVRLLLPDIAENRWFQRARPLCRAFSLLLQLTTTITLCSQFLRREQKQNKNKEGTDFHRSDVMLRLTLELVEFSAVIGSLVMIWLLANGFAPLTMV
jgi:hypothetical protein